MRGTLRTMGVRAAFAVWLPTHRRVRARGYAGPMKTWSLSLMLLFPAACTTFAEAPQATRAAVTPAATDHARLQGLWLAQTESLNGRTWAVTYTYAFAGDTLAFTDETGKVVDYAFTLDPAATPKVMHLRPVEAPVDTAPVPVAYAIEGDVLTLVIAPAGSRPTELSDRDDQELIVSRRKRP